MRRAARTGAQTNPLSWQEPGSSPQPFPNITRTHGARQKKTPGENPSVVLQQIARVVSHISSRSKQCVTISAKGRAECRGWGGVEVLGKEVGEVGVWGGAPTSAAHGPPLEHRGQSPPGSCNSATNRRLPAPPSSHCQNTKLFPDLFEAKSAALKGNCDTTRVRESTAAGERVRAERRSRGCGGEKIRASSMLCRTIAQNNASLKSTHTTEWIFFSLSGLPSSLGILCRSECLCRAEQICWGVYKPFYTVWVTFDPFWHLTAIKGTL